MNAGCGLSVCAIAEAARNRVSRSFLDTLPEPHDDVQPPGVWGTLMEKPASPYTQPRRRKGADLRLISECVRFCREALLSASYPFAGRGPMSKVTQQRLVAGAMIMLAWVPYHSQRLHSRSF
jgi:hypothetical protein